MTAPSQPLLWIVPTPIGNLGDITFRALEALKNASIIAAEDTRRTLILLNHYDIKARLVSFHEHNEARRTAELLENLRAGQTVALVTDAGMPGISDPGHRLIHACIENDIPFTVLPGASAVLTALVGSGLGAARFCFAGFLPVKSGQRQRCLQQALDREETTVFFESPHRLLKSLEVLRELSPSRPICVARELTKQFEDYRRGTPEELVAHYTAHPPRGEICLIVSGQK